MIDKCLENLTFGKSMDFILFTVVDISSFFFVDHLHTHTLIMT